MLKKSTLPTIAFLHIRRSQFIQNSRISRCAIRLRFGRSLLHKSQEPLLVLGRSFVRSSSQIFSIPGQLLKELTIAGTSRVWIEGFKSGEITAFLALSLLLTACLQDRFPG